jgi:hypothetical protein
MNAKNALENGPKRRQIVESHADFVRLSDPTARRADRTDLARDEQSAVRRESRQPTPSTTASTL